MYEVSPGVEACSVGPPSPLRSLIERWRDRARRQREAAHTAHTKSEWFGGMSCAATLESAAAELEDVLEEAA